MTGLFITIEGPDGSGKSTQMVRLCHLLGQLGFSVVQTREPGGSPFAEQLRAMLLDPATTMTEDSELLLMFAARADHVAQVILPALAQGKWVLCDRFSDSTIAYQGFGRKQGDRAELSKIELLIHQFVAKMPDMTIWLDLPVTEGMSRAKNRGKLDRFEQNQLAFFERVHQGFAYQAQQEPQRVKRIDAQGTADEVLAKVLTQLGI